MWINLVDLVCRTTVVSKATFQPFIDEFWLTIVFSCVVLNICEAATYVNLNYFHKVLHSKCNNL